MRLPRSFCRNFNIGLILSAGLLAFRGNASGQVGANLWTINLSDPALSSPAIGADGTIYVGCYDRKLHAISQTGTSNWSFSLPSGGFTGIYSSPSVGTNGTVYFGGEDGTLYALNPTNGASLWTFATGTAIYSSPALGLDGTVYFGSYKVQNNDKPFLYAITNGTQRWRFQPADGIFSSPVIAQDGTVYFGCDDGKLYAVTNGAMRWAFNTGPKAITASPAIGADGKVYIGVGSITNPRFFCVNTNGTTNWVITVGSRIRSAAAIASDGTIYFGCDDSKLYALNPDGSLKWSVTNGAAVGSSPSIAADGTIYVGCDDGKLYAYDSNGSNVWSFSGSPGIFSSPAITTSGTIFVGAGISGGTTGKFYAVRGNSNLANTFWPMIRRDARHTARAAALDTTPPVITWSFTNLVLVANTNCGAPMPDVTGTNFIVASDLSGPIAISQTPTNNAVLLLGTNVVVLTVQDLYGNAAYATNSIVVRDQTVPVITLNGGSPVYVEFGGGFSDPGATANDNCAGVVPVTVSGTVNLTALGTNTLTYTANDGNGNTNSVPRTVIVRDTTPPVITLNGGNPVLVELGGGFADPGATASDIYAGAVPVTVTGTVNPNAVGTNTLNYTANDGNGNTNTATRKVIVHDTTPPVITWSFTNLVLAADTNCGALMPDVIGTNFIVASDLSGPIALSQTPTNNAVLLLGTNVIVLRVQDLYGNTAFATNSIVVRDQTPPVITLNGGSLVYVEFGGGFSDPGATANDNCAGVVPVTVSGTVNPAALGTNTLIYTADDGNGNTNTATRTVIVHDTTPPAITWSFTNLVLAADTNCGALMPDVTGTNFIVASDLSGPIAISQTPTHNAALSLGTNVIVLTAQDLSGNAAYSTNSIVVQDQTPPAITLIGGSPVYVEFGGGFSDPGAMANDNCAGVVPVTVSGTVNLAALGSNMLTYTANDGNGNTNSVPRTVIIRDTTPPVITLNGGNPVFVELGGGFADPGATASDIYAGAVPVSVSGVVNPNAVGTNTLIYTADDGNGNTNSVPRTVIVRDTTPPAITWSFTNLVLAADTNCGALMPDVTGTNFIVASDLSGALTLSQSPTNEAPLLPGTNTVIITVADAYGNAACSTNNAVVLDLTPPGILMQPQGQTNLAGTTAYLRIVATACSPLAFQWYFNDSALAAQTNSTLTLSNLTSGFAGNYSAVATAAGGSSTSAVASLIVVVPPSILTPPQSQTVIQGSNATFNVEAIGTLPLSYRWQFNETNLTGASADTLTLVSVQPDEAGNYAVVVANDWGSVTSAVVSLTVEVPPSIISSPQSTTVVQGSNATFSVSSSGTGQLIYQWQFNGTNLAGAGGDTLVLTNVQSGDAGDYSVTVSNVAGITNSAAAVLAVIGRPVLLLPGLDEAVGFSFLLSGDTGRNFVIEVTTDFVTWTPLTTLSNIAGQAQVTDTNAAGSATSFYRARLLP